MKKSDLIARNNVLEEENRRRGEGRLKYSKWNIVLNPNTHVDNSINFTEDYIKDNIKQIIIHLADNLEDVIVFNKFDHGWHLPHIVSVKLRYAIEKGEGRRKKDGTYSQKGGFIHAHVRIEIAHRSNISLNYARLSSLLQPKFEQSFGKKGLIGTPRLVSEDQSERYITKDKKYKKGFKWVTIVR